jgi:hypothetical protein
LVYVLLFFFFSFSVGNIIAFGLILFISIFIYYYLFIYYYYFAILSYLVEPDSLDFENVIVKTYTGTFKSTKTLPTKPADATGSANTQEAFSMSSFIASATDIVKKSTEIASTVATEIVRNADELHSSLQRNSSVQLVQSSTQALTNAFSQSMQSLTAPLSSMTEMTTSPNQQQQREAGANLSVSPPPFLTTAPVLPSVPIEKVEPTTAAEVTEPTSPLTTLPNDAITLIDETINNTVSTTAVTPDSTQKSPEHGSNNNNSPEKPALSDPMSVQTPIIVTRTRVATQKRTPKLYQMQSLINGDMDEQELLQAELEKQQQQQLSGMPITITPSAMPSGTSQPSPTAFAFGSPSISTATTPKTFSPDTSVTPSEAAPENPSVANAEEPNEAAHATDSVNETAAEKPDPTASDAKDADYIESSSIETKETSDQTDQPASETSVGAQSDSTPITDAGEPTEPGLEREDSLSLSTGEVSPTNSSPTSSSADGDQGVVSSEVQPDASADSEVDLLTALMNRR